MVRDGALAPPHHEGLRYCRAAASCLTSWRRSVRGTPMANETATLAAYVAKLKYEDIPPEVIARAKMLTLDFLGSAVRARQEAESPPSILSMLAVLGLDVGGGATVCGNTKTYSTAIAALLNGAI